MKRLLWRAWDRAALYLPMLLMGVLALGAYWLVENTPAPQAVADARPARSEPDYYMQDFAVRSFLDSGQLRSEVFGERARHYPDSDTLEIDQVRIRSFDDQRRLTTATANRALSNADASEVQLFGNAVVVRDATTAANGERTPRMEFRGEHLHAYMDEDRVRSDRPVQITRGDDRFTADTMAYDDQQGVMDMRGRVRGVLAPRAPTPARP